MLNFQAYFRHGNAYADLRKPPPGAAPPVDPHSWSYESSFATDSASLQNAPLINSSDGRDKSPVLPPSSQLIISPETLPNGLRGLVPTIVAFTLSTGAGILFLAWLIAHQVNNKSVLGERAFLLDESRSARLTALAISSLTSHLIFVTGPILMSLVAFRIANLWITEQTTKHESDRMQPTILQYGLLVRVLSSLNAMSLFQALQYALRSPTRRFPSTIYYKEAMVTAATVYVLMHAVGATDLWLHTSTRTIPINSTLPLQRLPLYSISFNESLCPGGVVSRAGIVCQTHPDSWGSQSVRTMGHLIAADATGSDGLRVITLSAQPDAAFLVPSSIESGFTFRAQTFGVRARCTSLNERCQTATPLGDIGSCANVGLPMIPTADSLARLGESPSSYVFGLIGNTTVVGGGSIADRGYGLLTTNPARVVLQLRWSSGMNTLTPQPNPAVSVFPVPEIAVYASCELEVFNGMLEYLDGTYTLVREVPSDAGFTSMVWSPLIWQMATPRLVLNVQPLAMVASSTQAVMTVLNQELSRLTLATAGGLFRRVPAENTQLIQSQRLSRYPLAPVVTFTIVLLLYGAIAIAVFTTSALDASFAVIVPAELSEDGQPKTPSATELLHLRLTDPLSIVAGMYRQRERERNEQVDRMPPGKAVEGVDLAVALSVKMNTLDMISESPGSSTREGAYVGLGRAERSGRPEFGVWKWGHMYRYTDW